MQFFSVATMNPTPISGQSLKNNITRANDKYSKKIKIKSKRNKTLQGCIGRPHPLVRNHT